MYRILKTVSYGVEQTSIIKDNGNDQFTSFPADPENPNYAAYLAWLAEGNEPLPADPSSDPWAEVRAKRDQLIKDSDWTMTADASVDQAQWAAYRQILRDLPQTYAATGPESVVWPVAPSTAGPNSDTVE